MPYLHLLPRVRLMPRIHYHHGHGLLWYLLMSPFYMMWWMCIMGWCVLLMGAAAVMLVWQLVVWTYRAAKFILPILVRLAKWVYESYLLLLHRS